MLLLCGVMINISNAQENTDLSSRFDNLMNEAFPSNGPGATVLVSRQGQIIYQKAFGMASMELPVAMQADNVFRIGSITKQFTAIAILQLWEQGKLDLRDEITRFIPDYPMQGSKITIEHLLTHTSGIRNHSSMPDTAQRSRIDFTPKQMIDYFKNQPMRFAPGTKWEYSNSNYTILGYIIEKITGKTYAEYLDDNFFKPLGMTGSQYASDTKIIRNRAAGYTKPGKEIENAPYVSMSHPYAAGAILSSVGDLFKWNQAVKSYKLVKKETLDKAWSRYKLSDGSYANYGYGWRMGYIQGASTIWHAGLVQGFLTMAMYLPSEDVYVTVLANCDCNNPENIVAKMAAIAIGKPYEAKEITVDNKVLQQFVGVYENDKKQKRIISIADNKLYCQLNRAPKVPIKAWQQDKFFFANDAMQTIEFTRNSKGAVDKLITKSRTSVESWTKTNSPLPPEDGIKVAEKILDTYVGKYEIAPEFHFIVTREKDRLFVEPTGQDKFEIFAETENKFFLKINDAQLEFAKDSSGKVVKVILLQGERKTDARKID